MRSPRHLDDASPAQGGAEPAVIFDFQRRSYALPLDRIAGLGELGKVRTVPGAPSSIVGLTEWRGRLLTILDLPRLVADIAPPGIPCLARLTEPLGGHALYITGAAKLDQIETLTEPPSAALEAVRALQSEKIAHRIEPRILLRHLLVPTRG